MLCQEIYWKMRQRSIFYLQAENYLKRFLRSKRLQVAQRMKSMQRETVITRSLPILLFYFLLYPILRTSTQCTSILLHGLSTFTYWYKPFIPVLHWFLISLTTIFFWISSPLRTANHLPFCKKESRIWKIISQSSSTGMSVDLFLKRTSCFFLFSWWSALPEEGDFGFNQGYAKCFVIELYFHLFVLRSGMK